MKTLLIQLIQSYALQYGIDPQIAVTVAELESNFNPNVIGVTGDIGLFQLNPRSFPEYSREQLLDPVTNIELGIKYMRTLLSFCPHKRGLTWLVCWNYGLSNAKRVRHPSLFPYVKKARAVIHSARYLKAYETEVSLLDLNSRI